jgi:hypothetical protein
MGRRWVGRFLSEADFIFKKVGVASFGELVGPGRPGMKD